MFLINAKAICHDCNWETEGKNAMGNAAQHNKKRQHKVWVELYYGHFFNRPQGEEIMNRKDALE